MRYFQCRLRQNDALVVAWIEERGAKSGAQVEIPELGGLWRVVTCCPGPVDASWLREKQRVDRRGMPDI